jgi:hypothetical protein
MPKTIRAIFRGGFGRIHPPMTCLNDTNKFAALFNTLKLLIMGLILNQAPEMKF